MALLFVSIRLHCLVVYSCCVSEGDPADRIRMIVAAFTGFTSVGASIQSPQREDVRGVAVLLYSGMTVATF